MPTTIPLLRVERKPCGIPFALVALAMWALSLAIFGLDPGASAEMTAAAESASP